MNTTYVASIQGDNTAPVSGDYDGSTTIVQSNNRYELRSYVDEAGSGFGHVAFYFTRANKLYMPMGKNIWTDTVGLENINGVYYSSYIAETRPDARSLTLAGVSSNPYVRKGNFIRIDGIDRLITEVSGDTITWGDEVSTSITDFKIAHAMIVDSMITETPEDWDEDGNVIEFVGNIDDGDLMVETVERTGGRYNWTASINSKNIPDGPVTIHWVSFDKAGNYESKSIAANIANNRPRIASVILGTDLTGENDPAKTVKALVYSGLDGDGKAQSVVTIKSSSADPRPFTAVGLTTVDIEVVGGNGRIDYTLHNGSVDPGDNSLIEFMI
jgi:large repetitive protein